MTALKDKLWEELNSESNKLQAITEGGSIVHRDKDIGYFDNDFADWEDEELEDDDLEDDDIYDLEYLEDND